MAVERNPFDRIEQDNIIEIGIGPESTEIETGPVNMEFDDDGGVVIEFGDSDEGPDEIPEYAMDDEEGFFKNLVDDLDEDTLEEIANGVEKKIKVKRKIKASGTTYKTCSSCNGSGQVTRITNTILGRMQTSSPCTTCGGAGEMIDKKPAGADAQGLIVSEETVSIKIPAGVVDGMQLKVSGKGNEAPGNGIAGDLLVAITEEQHPTLQREGDNLHYDLYVSIPDAVLGTSKEIDTVTGKVRIKIEAGMQSGKILRLRGKGIPSINGYGKGDLLVHVNVWTPKTLDKKQKDFFESMKDDEHFDPKPESSDKSFFEKVKDMFS